MRLEHLGFGRVYDYVPGKTDWTAAGLPREGHSASMPNAGDLARLTVPSCHFRDPARVALKEVEASPEGFCVAVDENKIVLGILTPQEQEPHEDAKVEGVMRPGPTTIRANEELSGLVERMRRAGVDGILVTNAEGRLLGLMHRADAEEVLRDPSSA